MAELAVKIDCTLSAINAFNIFRNLDDDIAGIKKRDIQNLILSTDQYKNGIYVSPAIIGSYGNNSEELKGLKEGNIFKS